MTGTNKKGALFFTLDILIALTIIVSVFIVLGSTDVLSTPTGQVKSQLVDYTDFFYETTVVDANTNFNYTYSAPEFNAFSQSRRAQSSLFQEVSYEYHNNLGSRGSETVQNLTAIILPSTYSIEYKIDNTTIYSNIRTEKDEAQVHLTQRLITLTENRATEELIGPNTTEINIWI